MKPARVLAALAIVSLCACGPSLAKGREAGGAAMSAKKTIAQNIVGAKNEKTLAAALKAATLVDSLSGPGPFTVFVPTDAAFKKMPPTLLESLMQAEHKDRLASLLKYHVVPGRFSTQALMEKIRAGGGKAALKTIQGEALTLGLKGGRVVIEDAKGDTARITKGNVAQSNGLIHIVDGVMLLP